MSNAIPFNRKEIKLLVSPKFLLVILISTPSAIVAEYFNVPLAWMLGPMIIISIAALMGLKVVMPKLALSGILIILGLYIGTYIDQNLIDQMVNWIWTTIIMFFYILVSIIIVSKYLQKFSGYNEKTSIFSAAPGALGPLLILAEHENSDLSQVATAHLIRLIIIITVFPFVVDNFYIQEAASFEKIVPLGFKDWMGLEIDVTGKDNGYFPRKDSPIVGIYMPDAIAGFVGKDGKQYYVMANEGDDRDDFIEGEESIRLAKWKVELDGKKFPNAPKLVSKQWLGRLKTPKINGLNGDTDGDGDIDIIYTYGGRSFSIVDAQGNQVFESGDHVERWMGLAGGLDEKRSSKKGPEPEGVTVGTINDKVYAFIGIERGAGGVMVYEVSNPKTPKFVAYAKKDGDRSPEGLTFISSSDSPNGIGLLVVTNEKSSTLTVYEVK